MRRLLALLSITIAAGVAAPAAQAVAAPAAHPAPVVTAGPHPAHLAAYHARAAASSYLVRPGDTLSKIAAGACGTPSAWLALAGANAAILHGHPDLIMPGWRLAIDCTHPALAVHVAVTHHGPRGPPGDRWDGQHHACGDGDGDGYDMPCSFLPGHQAASAAPAQAAPASAPAPAPAAPAAPASSSGADWASVAQCESGGNWSTNTGNGFSGGLQFTPSTWAAYGGTAYAPQAWQASEADQIAVANRVAAGQGMGAWPHCG